MADVQVDRAALIEQADRLRNMSTDLWAHKDATGRDGTIQFSRDYINRLESLLRSAALSVPTPDLQPFKGLVEEWRAASRRDIERAPGMRDYYTKQQVLMGARVRADCARDLDAILRTQEGE